MTSRKTKTVVALILVICMVASIGVTIAFAKENTIEVGGTANEDSVESWKSIEEFQNYGITKGEAECFATFDITGSVKTRPAEIDTMAYVKAPSEGYIVIYGTGNYRAYTNESCTDLAKFYYTKKHDGVNEGAKQVLYNTSNLLYYVDVQKDDVLYFTGSNTWKTNLFVGFVPVSNKMEEPLVKIVGTNVVAGYASPNVIVSVKQGKKMFTGTADKNGFYAIKINKLKKNTKLTMWQDDDKANAIIVKIK